MYRSWCLKYMGKWKPGHIERSANKSQTVASFQRLNLLSYLYRIVFLILKYREEGIWQLPEGFKTELLTKNFNC